MIEITYLAAKEKTISQARNSHAEKDELAKS